MRLLSLLQHGCQPIPAQGVVGDRQHVAQPQAAAVAHQNPRGKQDLVRTMQRTPRHLRGHRKQVTHFVMGPCANEWQGVLDTANRPCTIVHQQAVSEGGFPQGTEHTPVVVDCGGSKMIQGMREVRIDVGDGQVANPPAESLSHHNELLSVAGASPHSEGVRLSVLPDGHGVCGNFVDLDEGGETTPSCGFRKSPAILGSHKAPLAQLDSVGRSGPPRGWLSRIVEGAFLALLVALIFCQAVGTLLTLLALGQFGRALVLVRRVSRRESVRPKDGASFKEVYR